MNCGKVCKLFKTAVFLSVCFFSFIHTLCTSWLLDNREVSNGDSKWTVCNNTKTFTSCMWFLFFNQIQWASCLDCLDIVLYRLRFCKKSFFAFHVFDSTHWASINIHTCGYLNENRFANVQCQITCNQVAATVTSRYGVRQSARPAHLGHQPVHIRWIENLPSLWGYPQTSISSSNRQTRRPRNSLLLPRRNRDEPNPVPLSILTP